MSMQEIFNHVATSLRDQNFERSILSDALSTAPYGQEVCAYFGEDGKKCALGHLIKPEMYDTNLENTCAETLLDDTSNADIWKYDVTDWRIRNMLESLQIAHDNGHDPLEMRQLLRGTAEFFDLDYPLFLAEENDPDTPETEQDDD